MEDLTKEHLITLFQNQIEKLDNSDRLIRLGSIEEPEHLFQISNNISIALQQQENEPNHSIRITFGGFVDYKVFEIKKHEYDYLVTLFEKVETTLLLDKKKEIISQGEMELNQLLN